ncbi:MAG: glycine reductase [Tissierellia bacterium]|nr:glycine reductase [Tissierellia bacterium]
MTFPVIKGAGYILAHTPDMIVQNGSTCSVERITHPESEFLKEVGKHIRSYEDAVNYLPNQIYIGNVRPEEMIGKPLPWTAIEHKGTREGKFGQIIPEEEFIALMQLCDVFDLVFLSEDFVSKMKAVVENAYPELEAFFGKIKGSDIAQDMAKIPEHLREELIFQGEVVGYVKAAHDVDVNLSAHTMFENLVAKTSGVLSVLAMLKNTGIAPESIDYVLECSEEACGDINQRGGGNFAKAIAEVAGLKNASGSDTRGFCAAPVHAMVEASALVKSGIFKNVLVVAGGSTAKLGMNAKDHIAKGLPVIEDVVGGFAVLVSENDGVHPVIRTDMIGKHNVGTGASPQAVMTALIADALAKGGLKSTDIDTFSVEMQNPDITVPAKAGNVPEANYKMIAALAVKNGEIERKELADFISAKGLPGWAPTQGHIPSGVPYAGFMIDDLTTGDKNRDMIVGKGSIFLGRMTNLFDGLSFIIERNSGEKEESSSTDKEQIRQLLAEAMAQMAQELLKKEE